MRLCSGLLHVFATIYGMDFIIVEMASTATIAITVFGIVFCLMQTKYSRVSRSFAVFLGTVTVNNIPDAFHRFFEGADNIYVQTAELIIWTPSSLCVAPLFWLYVFTLTSTEDGQPARLFRHFVLPAFAVLIGLIAALTSPYIGSALAYDDAIIPTGWRLALISVIVLLHVSLYPQMAIYLYLILRRMMRYRLMLRDFYASTEEHELRWIYVIGGLGGLYWLGRVLLLIFGFDPEQADTFAVFLGFAGFCNLALIAAMTLWGLRQRPPLMPDTNDESPPEITEEIPPHQPSEKYGKSALSPEASSRIERKLRAAMEQDHLHRDPNLSLWALARHTGASSNYISQTLNEVVGESFFDFVNGYRISEAKELLSTTNATVLTITYDVGFNARSSFYNAFKRVTGQTPTSYRKTLSHRVGMDDVRG